MADRGRIGLEYLRAGRFANLCARFWVIKKSADLSDQNGFVVHINHTGTFTIFGDLSGGRIVGNDQSAARRHGLDHGP